MISSIYFFFQGGLRCSPDYSKSGLQYLARDIDLTETYSVYLFTSPVDKNFYTGQELEWT